MVLFEAIGRKKRGIKMTNEQLTALLPTSEAEIQREMVTRLESYE